MHRIILGLWPMAGITSGRVSRETSLTIIQAAIDAGIDTFDTAFSYGYDGESDRWLGEVLQRTENKTKRLVVIGKVGQRWTTDRRRVVDASPERLTADAELSLKRMGLEQFDLLMLHAVDLQVELGRAAKALDALHRRGLAARLGICNTNAEELIRFAEACPCSVIQCPLNLLQPDSLDPLIATAAKRKMESHVYWTLMKGLLAGRISRDHVFDAGDSRPTYGVFQGEARQRAHDVIDRLSLIATRYDTTVARLAIGWALSQPGVTAALVGAKHPQQIAETAVATSLNDDVLAEVNRAAAMEPLT